MPRKAVLSVDEITRGRWSKDAPAVGPSTQWVPAGAEEAGH
jgi:hypothetical protein